MNRQGVKRKNLSGRLGYCSFVPSSLPPHPEIIIDYELLMLLSNAYLSLGQLEGLSNYITDRDVYVSMYIRREALLSSQIEGTQASLNDIFDPDLNTYQSGWISYPLNGLSDGMHTITLKAWDTYNNPSEKTISPLFMCFSTAICFMAET